MFNKYNLSVRLYELRITKKISQKELAEAVGVSYFTIGKIELAQRAASIELLYALADYFDVSLDYLVGRTDNPNVNR